MDHFGLPEDLTRCERALSSSNDVAARAKLLAELAWYLRERDAARALAITGECLALLTSTPRIQAADGLRSRLDLVIAVRRNLEGRVQEGLALARRSQATFATLGDPVGEGDALIVQYQILVNLGDMASTTQALADADATLRQADAVRRYTVMARTAMVQSFTDPAAAEARWYEPLAGAPAHAGVVAVVRSFLGYVKMTRGAYADALRDLGVAIEACHTSGQTVLSASAMGNTAVAFCNLSDLDQALEWSERALAQAQALDARLLVTRALGQVGITLHAMGRLSAAREFLQQALAAMEPLNRRSDRTFLQRSLVHLLVQMGDHERALELNEEVLHCAKDFHSDMLALASIDQAQALLGVGRHEEALRLGLQTLEREQRSGNHLYIGDVMRLLASIHRARSAPAPAGSSAPSGAIHYMLGYLEAVSSVEDHTVRHEDLAALSADYEAAGDLANALRYARLAADARTRSQTKQASDLATALQVRHDTERMREEAQHSRMLAAAERDRAELLLTANETLERLAAIGRDITANMDLQGLFGTLHRHVGALLDVSFIGIWIVDEDALVLLFGMEDGQPIPELRLALHASDSLAARCARERREFIGGCMERDVGLTVVPGTRRMSSAFFAPMLAEDKVIGVLSVQADKDDAYGEREAQILRTLAAYVAVALANVSTARELAEARSELEHEKMRGVLVHAGKMVTVGRMASGLVHEIAHPVLTMSLLTDTVGDLLAQNRIPQALSALKQIARESERLQQLTRRLRDFARAGPDGQAELRSVELRRVVNDARALFEAQLHKDRIEYVEAIEPVTLWCDPERLALILVNLVSNAAHAICAGSDTGRRVVEVRSQRLDNGISLTVHDSGPGISPPAMKRLFEPFFTTKPPGEGLGLGLALSVEAVTSMGGRITACNGVDGGAVFTVTIPLDPAAVP